MKDLAQSGKTALEQVVFVTFSASDYRTYQEAYREKSLRTVLPIRDPPRWGN